MASKDKIILVTGATGNQGSAAARHLLKHGWSVRALTRSASSEKAQALAKAGAEVVEGDFNDAEALKTAFSGVYGVFSVQNFWVTGYDEEVKQGKIVADSAKAAGVEHFVFTSVGGAERKTGIPHFDSKWEIEEHISQIGLKATVVRPVFFMENFFSPDWNNAIRNNSILPMSLNTNKPVQMIAVDDIGAYVALVFSQPEKFIGQAIELAGDELTGPEACALFSEKMKKQINYVEVPIEKLRESSKEFAIMFEWFNEKGYEADIPALRAQLPQLKTLKTWIEENWQ